MSALGHKRTWRCQISMSALPPKADMCCATRDVRFVPKAALQQTASLFKEGRREIPQISAGDTVLHDKWGEGVVLTVKGSGTDAEATVRFEDAGEKRLLVAYAPLRKVG